jgi:hypothetical protein
MFDRELTIYRFLLGYCKYLIADIDDARFADQPSAGVNHPAWLLGHLTVVGNSGLNQLGAAVALPEGWPRIFGRGSQPIPDRAAYPSKDELIAALEACHERVDAAVRNALPETMAEPNPLEMLRAGLPTRGDLLAHMLTAHEAAHLGHLSNWRRQMGMPYLF